MRQQPTWGLAKASNLFASPLNKNIFVVRSGRKSQFILTAFFQKSKLQRRLRQAFNVAGNIRQLSRIKTNIISQVTQYTFI